MEHGLMIKKLINIANLKYAGPIFGRAKQN